MTPDIYEVVAHNYAHDADNKIHDDAVAARYGFRGGLVPGAADLAYLAHAVHGAWGDGWLDQGAIQAKFIKPVYHGERVRAVAAPGDDPQRLTLTLTDPRGETCAVGEARRRHGEATPSVSAFPRRELPRDPELPEPTPEGFPDGHVLGSYEYRYDAVACEREIRERFVVPLDAGDGTHPWHPGLCAHLGNQVLLRNVRLGPWVHTASEIRLHGVPGDGDAVSVRGRVERTYLRRGHVMTECDLLIVADGERALARARHTAIIRLAADG